MCAARSGDRAWPNAHGLFYRKLLCWRCRAVVDVPAVAVGRERTANDDCAAALAAANLASGGFSLGCLRNRCSRLLQLSDNNWVTLVVEERA